MYSWLEAWVDLLLARSVGPMKNIKIGMSHIGMDMKPKMKSAHFGVTPVKKYNTTRGIHPPNRTRPTAAAVRAESVPAGG